MSIKKKIVIAISIISIMILCFSISSFAVVYPNGMELNNGDVIVFKDSISLTPYFNYTLNFTSNSRNCDGIKSAYSGGNVLFYSIVGSTETSAYSNNRWSNNAYKTITISGDQTITDEDFINWLYENTVSGIPEPPTPPHLEPSFWETVSGFFYEALASGTSIVNWMTITPISLIPLALYCLIVIIAITKRMIKG